MKILLVVAYFVPEIGSAAHVYLDLAKAFVRRGHEVDVITSYPRKFNLTKADVDKEFPMDDVVEGIKIHRCKYNTNRDNIILRGLEHFLLPEYYFRAYRKLEKKFDACLIYIPPLPLYYFARKIKKYNGTPSVLNYQDFHPQELTDVGILKNRSMIKFMEYIERQSYINADYVVVLSEGGIDYVTKRGGDPSRIEHIYNGCVCSDFNNSLVKKDFKEKEGIEDKFLITYAGILSPFQGVDNILNAAKGLTMYGNIVFYIFGDGMIKGHLYNRIMNENISNVKLMPLQSRDEYLNIVNSSDVSLVSLDDRMKAPCLPGKLINLMAMKQPMIAIVPEDCETARVIRKSKSGIVIKPGNSEELMNTILNLYSDFQTLRKYGENGRNFLEENMDLSKNITKYEQIFVSINR